MVDQLHPIGDIDLVTDETLVELAAHRAPACISMFIPTHTVAPATQQDPIRLTNLVRAAEARLLEDLGTARREAEALLAPVRALVDDLDFWRHQSSGLAVYVAQDVLRTLRVPLPLTEGVFVGGAFRVRPLLPLLSGNGRFYLLALSQNEVRLFEGTRFTMSELPLGRIPSSMAEALAHEDPEAQLQIRSGGQGGMFHGHGVGDEVDKQALERFIRLVDRGVQAELGSAPHPLVLAAVRYYLPIYRSVTNRVALAERTVEGAPEGRSPGELHDQAWEIASPMFAGRRHDARERLRAALGQDRAALGAVAVVGAALAGRVATLFLRDDEPCWGRADDTGNVALSAAMEAGDDDVLERAALATLAAGGEVYVDAAAVPEPEVAAALLRW
ncbi:MAG: hypothetical protein AB7Q42_08130 [Acidimicrobiia bacterium]